MGKTPSGLPSAHQRYYAIALGIAVPAHVGREQLSRMIDEAKGAFRGGARATDRQKSIAKMWEIECEESISAYDLAGQLFEFQLVRPWVYSVYRHMVGGRGRKHSDCALPEDVVNRITNSIFQNQNLLKQVQRREDSNPLGDDAWYRITSKAASEDSYLFVAELLHRDLNESLTEPRTAPAPRAKTIADSSQRGCLSVVARVCLILFALIIAMAGL